MGCQNSRLADVTTPTVETWHPNNPTRRITMEDGKLWTVVLFMLAVFVFDPGCF